LSLDIINYVDDLFRFFRNCFLVLWFSDQNGIVPIICKEWCFSGG
jgi:hypothetical protein